MKQIKKLLALILVLTMVLSLSITAFATGDGDDDTPTPPTYSITVSDAKAGHTYTAYQIFAADIADVNGEKVLSNISWGSGVSITDKLEDKTASQWAKSLNNVEDDSSAAKAFAQKINASLTGGTASTGGVISGVEAGYYLVKDTTDKVPEGHAVTYYLLEVVDQNVTVYPKVVAPTLEKKVQDNDDTTGWVDSADYNIGDTVPFQLTATISKDNIAYYSTYKVIFHDTLSAGLTIDSTSIAATINGDSVSATYAAGTAAGSFTIDLGDVKDKLTARSNTIVVTYNATLNSNAVIGAAGNPNTAYLEFSNNPNVDTQTGTTPEDKVTVFTFELIVNKVTANTGDDKDENPYVPLNGADFTLYKKVNNNWVDVTTLHAATHPTKSEVTNTTNSFTFSGLDAGEYKLVETTTPNGYNTIDDIEFTITATHELASNDPRLTGLVISDETFTVKTDTVTENSETKEVPTGTISGDVINNAGFTLPSTGGMGTTMFYVIGALMVFGAVVMLITKKRMAK